MNVLIEEIKWEELYGIIRGLKRLCIYYFFMKFLFEMSEKEREVLVERMVFEMKKLEKVMKKIFYWCC